MKTLEQWEKHFDVMVKDAEGFIEKGNNEDTKFTQDDFLINCQNSTMMIIGGHQKEFFENVHEAINKKEDKGGNKMTDLEMAQDLVDRGCEIGYEDDGKEITYDVSMMIDIATGLGFKYDEGTELWIR